MSTDETQPVEGDENAADVEIDEDEIDQAEIDEIKQHAADPSAPRSVLHYFSAPTREKAQLCAGALNAKYGPSGGAASFDDAEIDLTDPEYDPEAAFEVVFEHEAVVNDAYMETIRDIESIGDAAGAEYGGWQAEEG
ncbi:MAG TPA: ribonuclease E inhibitor RraB [Candidatus Baltobacteraceae bacterium]|nr:ribonuclease E inhibitor RraB [Candidatus Baltobacteraceae bacterium]